MNRSSGFNYCVRSRLGDRLVAATRTKKMAERIMVGLTMTDRHSNLLNDAVDWIRREVNASECELPDAEEILGRAEALKEQVDG